MNQNKIGSWVQGAAAAFLVATAAVSFAVAGGRSAAISSAAEQSMSSGYVPPGMHEANGDLDVGPGADEAQAASSPQAR